MPQLSKQTLANYRHRLKLLRRVLPLMPESDPERVKAVAEIERLTNKLGKEMTDLESWLAKKPGRNRQSADVDPYKALMKREEDKVRDDETPAERDARIAAFRARVLADNPEFAAEQERKRLELEDSEKRLVEMQKLANEEVGKDGQSSTDESGKAGGDSGRPKVS